MNTEQERAAFEWWYGKHVEPRLTGTSTFMRNIAFEAYQAGRAALQSQSNHDTTLFCDLKSDEEKSAFFLTGRGYETGVIAQAIQNDVAMAYHRCAEYKKELVALQSQNRTAWINTLERKAETLWTAAGEDRHEAMKDLLHHARIGVQSQDREDAERLDWMEDKARRSRSGVSVDYQNLVEDGYVIEKGFRFMSHRFIGGCFKTIRGAIDHARRVEGDGE